MLGAILAKRELTKAFTSLGKDPDVMVSAFAEDGVYEFPGESAMSGRHEGRDEIRKFATAWADRMSSIQFKVRHVSVENIFAMGPSNHIHVEWDLDETTREGDAYHFTGVSSFHVKGGKVSHAKCYIPEQDQLAKIWPKLETAS